MKCSDITNDLLIDFHDSGMALASALRQDLQLHLNQCSMCEHQLQQVLTLRDAIRESEKLNPAIPTPNAMRQSILHMADEAAKENRQRLLRGRSPVTGSGIPWPRMAALIAVVLIPLAIVVSFDVFPVMSEKKNAVTKTDIPMAARGDDKHPIPPAENPETVMDDAGPVIRIHGDEQPRRLWEPGGSIFDLFNDRDNSVPRRIRFEEPRLIPDLRDVTVERNGGTLQDNKTPVDLVHDPDKAMSGDIDGNGRLEAVDAELLAARITDPDATLDDYDDFNDDGLVDIIDCLLIARSARTP